MAYDFEVAGVVPATCEQVYTAWLSSEQHTAMTGGEAVIEPWVDGGFTAWDGYINGTTKEHEPFHRIVQSWRTRNFSDDDPDSVIEVLFDTAPDGTLVTVRHSNVPDDHRGYEDGGWQENYFDPMRDYFSTP